MATDTDGDYQGEGGLGIMRVYKSANCNETHAGFLGGIAGKINRGNHIIHVNTGEMFTIPDISLSFELGGIDYGKQLSSALFSPVKSAISSMFSGVAQLADIAPSCGNKRNSIPYMCREVDDSVALYSEYRWASAKWFCYWKRKKLRWKAKWKFHLGLPKTACGTPNYLMLKFIPPYGLPCEGHGYMKNTLDIDGLIKPLRYALGGGNISRNNYESCAMMIDDSNPPYLQGHARIYGDDKEIFDKHYAGGQARPWILNEKFFADDGTVIVGVSRKQKNPFAQIFKKIDEVPGLFGIFNPPGKDDGGKPAIWALSAARAGVRRVRQGAAERDYAVYFDDAHQNLDKHKDVTDAKNFEDTDKTVKVQAGCVCCTKAESLKKITGNWNLCEVDWDATLLPMRYAGQSTVTDGQSKRFWNSSNAFPADNAASFIYRGTWKELSTGADCNTSALDTIVENAVEVFKQNKIY